MFGVFKYFFLNLQYQTFSFPFWTCLLQISFYRLGRAFLTLQIFLNCHQLPSRSRYILFHIKKFSFQLLFCITWCLFWSRLWAVLVSAGLPWRTTWTLLTCRYPNTCQYRHRMNPVIWRNWSSLPKLSNKDASS